jgi:glycine/D-amino acid oxidase-like deaminating enzyme
MASDATWDTIVIGGGLAGLTVARELATRGDRVLLVEKYKVYGGRALTYRGPPRAIQYEIGAGRIWRRHARVAALVRRFGLHTFPISTASDFERVGNANPFTTLFEPLRAAIAAAPPDTLARHTIAEIVPLAMHHIFAMYPYWAEIHTLRADVALKAFKPSEPMGATGDADYYGIVEGIDAITSHLADAARDAGAILRNRHRVGDVRRSGAHFEIVGDAGKKAHARPFTYVARRVVIATCRCSLSGFSVLRGAPLLKQIGTAALMRIYAVFPRDAATGRVWFDGMPKIVTASRLRYVIPINAEKGLIMISYTDGVDTNYWRELEGDELERAVLREARALFSDRVIPAPTYIQKHDWSQGCSYWLPGDYDVVPASAAAHNPAEGVYVCGESVSMTQTWMEGALESAEFLLSIVP